MPLRVAPVYVWEPPGKQIAIHLSLQAIERMGATLEARAQREGQRAAESGGLLLGKFESSDPRVTVVEDFEPLVSEHSRGPSYVLSGKDRAALEKRLRHAAQSRLTVVGYFRLHTRPGLYLDQDDFSIINDYFNHPNHVFLLIRPASGEAQAGFFFWEDGDLRRQAPYLSFPFESRQLLAGEYRIVPRPSEAPQPSPRPQEQPPEPAAPRWTLPQFGFFRDKRLWVATGTAAALLSVGILSLHHGAPAPLLALHVEKDGPALKLLWDKTSPLVRRARGAVVKITDGVSAYEMRLTSRELALGSIVYFPSTPDVAFDFRVNGAGGVRSEIVRTFAPAAATVRPPVHEIPAQALTPLPVPAPPSGDREDADASYPELKPRTVHFGRRGASGGADRLFPPRRPAPRTALIEPPSNIPAAVPPEVHLAPEPLARLHTQATVTAEPAPPSGLSRVVSRIPLLRRLRGKHNTRDGFAPPRPLREVKPAVPPSLLADDTDEVDLKVRIDETGRVLGTEFLRRGTQPMVAGLVRDAAREWEFQPAERNGRPVSSEMVLHFRFRR
ncbi:MAG: energy transducer TonB [Acidobacteria bacterium]|nr:energy transducer TonB [Acidobacteriota bacterium]